MPPPLEILLLVLSLYVQMTSGDQCSSGSNFFTEIPENSPSGTFVANLSMFGDPVTSTVRLCLSGTDADWFYLDGKNIWLNVSSGKTLDREALNSSVLLVTLTCKEEGFPAVQYRIFIQILNQNDNMPTFLEESVAAQNISELTEVDSVVFTAQAMDLDGDIIMYVIDQTTGDFKYFHMDLPSNGKVLLSQPLDYESKQELEVVIHAVEITTRERHSTSARIRITVLDGDDQYPYFLPCIYMPHDGLSVCVSPIYRANITVGQEQTGTIVFSPGPIIAEDGDKGILAPISYSFLSGSDNEMFQIDNVTGSISLTHAVEISSSSSILLLKVMACQVGDPRKYAIAEVEIRVLTTNHHAPLFGSTEYQAFVQEDSSPAALVRTYNGKLLSLMPSDGDFYNGTNPHIRLSLSSLSNHSQLFQITQSGLLIARTNQLQATKSYFLQVIARDEESGEAANCSVVVNVLAYGEPAPLDPSEPRFMFTVPDLPIIAGGLGALVILFAVLLFFLIWALRGHQQQQQQRSRTSLVTEKHPSVSLQWYHTAEEQGYQNAAYTESLGEENSQERGHVHPPSGQTTNKESSTADGHQGKQQQKKAPAVAVISPGNQCVGRSPFKNGKEKEDDSLNAIPHTHLAAEKDLHSAKVRITQALVTNEQEDNQPLKSVPAESYVFHPPCAQPSDANKQPAEKQDGTVLWPDPPVLSRLPVVVEVNEEVVEPEGDQTEYHPQMGSEIITPDSLMQLLEDSIEC
eukprot:XP_017948144.1 PREDICTED: cadherin-related family member 5-like [Xenopus tropicalis]